MFGSSPVRVTPSSPRRGEVVIYDISATGLPDGDRKMGQGCTDPYMVITLHQGKEVRSARTKTVPNVRNVKWHEALTLPVVLQGDELEAELVVRIMDDDSAQNEVDDEIGKVHIPINSKKGRVLRVCNGNGFLYAFQVSFSYEYRPFQVARLTSRSSSGYSPRRRSYMVPLRLPTLLFVPGESAVVDCGFRRGGFMRARREREEREKQQMAHQKRLQCSSPSANTSSTATSRSESPGAA